MDDKRINNECDDRKLLSYEVWGKVNGSSILQGAEWISWIFTELNEILEWRTNQWRTIWPIYSNIFDGRHQWYDEMVCCCEGDVLGLIRHCGKVMCDSPIGPAHFRIETEAQERMSTRNGVFDRTDHHVLGWHSRHEVASWWTRDEGCASGFDQ